MKVTIERAQLLKGMGRAQGVVERKNTIPILANVLIEAKGDRISLRATDLDLEVIEDIPAVVEQPGTTTVPAHLLHEIVRKLPDGAQLKLRVDGGNDRLEISAGRSRFTLATLPREDFPVMASSEYQCTFKAPVPVIRRLFEKSQFAVSTEETRYYLNGVYLHVVDEGGAKKLRAVATDGHRLARIDAGLPDGADNAPGVIVPRKTVGELRKLLDNDEGEITISVSETKIRFAADGLVLTSKVIDGAFPDYSRVIPQSNTRRLEVDAAEFADAVNLVATVSQERSRAIKLSMEQDKLTLSVNSPEAGSATDELAVAYGDEDMEIGFNARYLLEIASQVDRENAVFLFADPNAPTLVREGDDDSAVYVVMPMRV
jgi:DNA polymerase-3 subunit beta